MREFPGRAEQADALIEKAEHYAEAIRLYAEKNYKEVYDLLDRFPELEETDIVQRLEDAWMQIVKRAEKLANEGKVAEIRKLFGTFLTIPTKKPKILSIVKGAYIAQIETLFRQKSNDRRRAIEKYIELFGMDDEIASWLQSKKIEGQFEEVPARDYSHINIMSRPDTLV